MTNDPLVVAPLLTHTVPEGAPRLRLDRYLSEVFGTVLPTRSAARKAVKRGEILLDGELPVSHRWITPGHTITLLPSERTNHRTFDLAIPVLFEDEYIAIVHKPAGFPVNGNRHRTIEHALPHNLRRSEQPDAFAYPRPAHRLDARTEGILLVAKTRTAHAGLTHQFQERSVHKEYRAIALGRLEGEGTVETPLDGRAATTRWRCIENTRSLRTHWVTTVALEPVTGRMHQLRRHLAELGHPILGDAAYHPERERALRGKGLYLASVAVRFRHPIDGTEVHSTIPEPHKFTSFRTREIRRWAKFYPEDQ